MKALTKSCVFLLGIAVTMFAHSSADWSTFQGNPSHTGYVPESFDSNNFELKWQRPIGDGKALNPVAVGDGIVFVTNLGYFNDPGLYVHNAETGSELWRITYGDVFSVNPPAFNNGKVYIQTGNHSSDTYLRAYTADTGQLVFQAAHQAQWGRYYAPTIVDDVVYINGGTYGGMYAFDANNGAQLWFHGLPQYDEWTPAVDSSLAYAYVGEYAPGLYAIDRSTGAEVFKISDPNFDWNGWSMDSAPVLGGASDIFAIHDGRLIRFDLTNRIIDWELQRNFKGQPSVARGVIYAIDSGALTAWDQLTGTLLWSWSSPADTLHGPLLVTDSHIFANGQNSVYAIDVDTHLSDWSYPASGHLAIAGGTLYIASTTGLLTVINMGPPPDQDNDGVQDRDDNCPADYNPDQTDTDNDGIGDICNDLIDIDGDEWADQLDNCPDIANDDQANQDGDEFGDICDPFPNNSDNLRICLGVLDDQAQGISNLQSQILLLESKLNDADNDGIIDLYDTCNNTANGMSVDATGCSLAQFCSAYTGDGKACGKADWGNDEPMSNAPEDCLYTGGRKAENGACVAAY